MFSYNLHEKECQSPAVPLKWKVLILWVKGDPHSSNKEDQTSETKAKFSKFLYLPVIQPVIQVPPPSIFQLFKTKFFQWILSSSQIDLHMVLPTCVHSYFSASAQSITPRRSLFLPPYLSFPSIDPTPPSRPHSKPISSMKTFWPQLLSLPWPLLALTIYISIWYLHCCMAIFISLYNLFLCILPSWKTFQPSEGHFHLSDYHPANLTNLLTRLYPS